MTTMAEGITPGKSGISGVHAWLVLWKATNAIQRTARKDIRKRNVADSDFGVLDVLLHKGPQPVNEIGKRVLLTSGSMTAAIDRLQQRGWVTRKNDPADHRTRMVYLTAAGRRWIERAFAEHAERMEAAFSSLNREEREQLIALLKKVGKQQE